MIGLSADDEAVSAGEGFGGEAPPSSKCLHIHATVAQLQQLNGLRHSDFEQYRRYTTRRLRRIRKALPNFNHGRGRNFVPREVTEEDVKGDFNCLLIPLLNAERAWSYAMQLKQAIARGGGHAAVTNHLLRRLSKAVKWSGLLESLCAACADERTGLEANAYAAWMAGNLHLEREAWAQALDRFTTAHQICQQLGTIGTMEHQDLFTQRSDEIGQSIRYCNYNISGASGPDAVQQPEVDGAAGDLQAKLDAVVDNARSNQSDTLEQISWRNRKIAVRDEKVQLVTLLIPSPYSRRRQSLNARFGSLSLKRMS